MKKINLLILLLSLFLCFSCNSVKEIPEDKTAAQIIQMGQDALSSGKYLIAENCFLTAIQRYESVPSVYVEAKYELGNVYLKEKKYQNAYTIFNELLSIYEENVYGLPYAYQKLAKIGLSKIPQKELEKLQ